MIAALSLTGLSLLAATGKPKAFPYTYDQHDMENAVAILSPEDRITLTTLLRRLGRDAQAQLDTPGRKTDFSRSEGASKRQKEKA